MSSRKKSRQEQRNLINSQNITWRNDDSKFGQVMLEKMGWKPGSGLGKYEQGITENLQMKANVLTKGLGCNERNDEVWIAHHDSFAAILADLNKKKENSKAANPVRNNLNKVKSKVILNEHRKDRYIPNLSMMSEKDKCAIFGKRSAPSTSDKSIDENKQKDEVKSAPASGNMIVNKISINDYFAEKMLKLNERRKI
ncbi:MGC82072 protein, putative [Brugia malayi]|uniref:Bm5963 n=1 Tax=Brugia malayi TaxID=6279 RepID=A0A0K0JL49_BRUMA|nr:MGC82072 protein, putative [Brugia malayi]CRZ24122.1 Bm5963 [Brugia malayi]VIO97088.1 MGC82072 protein, putative [Brugia malayi]